MSELGGVRDRGENTLVPDLLGWMGAAFGDAVERAGVRRLRLGRAQMEEVIRALPAAIYTTDAAGRITYYNESAAELGAADPNWEKASSAAPGSSIGPMAGLCPTGNLQWRWR